jgi:polyisoprenoid-binding protein YceI
MRRLAIAAVLLSVVASGALADTYSIDPGHSSVGFKVKHVIGKVAGHFDKFSGAISYDPAKPGTMTAEATIDATSINTGIDKRDAHLKSPDFFDVVKYPTLTFKSTKVGSVQGSKVMLPGVLTMHGVSKPVVLTVDVSGVAADSWGGQRAGASAITLVSRSDFNIGPSSGPVSGMVGKDVEISIDVEAVKKK